MSRLRRITALLILMTAVVCRISAEEQPERLDFDVDISVLAGVGYDISYDGVWSAGVGAEFLWVIPRTSGVPWSMGFGIDAHFHSSFTHSISESGTLIIPLQYRSYLRLGRNSFVAGFGPEIAIVNGFSAFDFLISASAGLSIPTGSAGKLNIELKAALDANIVPENDYLMLFLRYGF